MATLTVLLQLTDTYLRWLAFARRVTAAVNRRLWLAFFVWGAASFVLYNFIFDSFGINATTYKAILMLGWLPYFLICFRLVPWGLTQHLFVLSMGVVCSLIQHSVSAIIILLNIHGKTDAEYIFFEAAIYLLLFAIFLPICGEYFSRLLLAREFFDMRPLGIYIAVLPLVIVSGHLIRLADGVLIHSWAERFSRIYLPVVFFFFYRYILSAAKNFYDMQKLERNKRRLEHQLSALKEYNEIILENQKRVSVMRHDLRHSYNLIYAMLESGNVAKAREHINTQQLLLKAASAQSFCELPLINAALTIYLRRAEEANIQVFSKINLPSKLETDETDFTILISNLLEKIISVAEKNLSIIIQHVEGQCVLEISARSNAPLHFGDALKTFIEEYNAYADFNLRGDRVNLLMYWDDRGN